MTALPPDVREKLCRELLDTAKAYRDSMRFGEQEELDAEIERVNDLIQRTEDAILRDHADAFRRELDTDGAVLASVDAPAIDWPGKWNGPYRLADDDGQEEFVTLLDADGEPVDSDTVVALLNARVTQPAPAAEEPVLLTVEALATEISRVAGDTDDGAEAIAERLMPFLLAHPPRAAVTEADIDRGARVMAYGWRGNPHMSGDDRDFMTPYQRRKHDARFRAALEAALGGRGSDG